MAEQEKLHSKDDLKLVEKLAESKKDILKQLHKVIVGQDSVIEELLIALFSRGHCLIEGVPGLAKTLLVDSLSKILDLEFRRIQFTPDLMPSDITGTDVIEEEANSKTRCFRYIQGPIFANIVLADEINRTPPKTQSALLQAMQEYHVTASGKSYPLPLPFYVLATQNPIEQEGTYPLPEAQLDRFFFKILINYPDREEEIEIVKSTTAFQEIALFKVLNSKEIIKLQDIVRKVPVSDHVVEYAVSLVAATRPKSDKAPASVKDLVQWGAGPRASQCLILGSKARAVLQGRLTASVEDVKALAFPVLRHRLVLSFQAEAEGVTSEQVVQKILNAVSA